MAAAQATARRSAGPLLSRCSLVTAASAAAASRSGAEPASQRAVGGEADSAADHSGDGGGVSQQGEHSGYGGGGNEGEGDAFRGHAASVTSDNRHEHCQGQECGKYRGGDHAAAGHGCGSGCGADTGGVQAADDEWHCRGGSAWQGLAECGSGQYDAERKSMGDAAAGCPEGCSYQLAVGQQARSLEQQRQHADPPQCCGQPVPDPLYPGKLGEQEIDRKGEDDDLGHRPGHAATSWPRGRLVHTVHCFEREGAPRTWARADRPHRPGLSGTDAPRGPIGQVGADLWPCRCCGRTSTVSGRAPGDRTAFGHSCSKRRRASSDPGRAAVELSPDSTSAVRRLAASRISTSPPTALSQPPEHTQT